jgi:ABC-type amino acid transport system permease subunit
MWIFVIAIFFGLCFASLLYLFNKKQHYSKSLTFLLFILRFTATSLLVILFLFVIFYFYSPYEGKCRCLNPLEQTSPHGTHVSPLCALLPVD